jgi:cytochrome P450
MLTRHTLDEAVSAILAGKPDAVRDPYPVYQEMRELGAVYWHKSSIPFITRHAEAKALFRDDTRFLTRRGEERFKLDSLSEEDRQRVREICAFEALQLSGMNGEIHRRVRNAATRGFSPTRMMELGEYAKDVTNDLLDEIASANIGDIVDLTYRLPLLVLMEMLGAPKSDAERLKTWGDDIAGVKQYVAGGVPTDKIRKAHEAIGHMKIYAAEMAERFRQKPNQSYLMGALLDAEEGDRLSQDELTGTLVVILYAGHLTTTDMIGNGIHDLLRYRDQWKLLCSNPALVKSAVEETLRFNAPVQMMVRMPIADAEIAGEIIPAGTGTMILYASANRDPQVFSNPDQLDITRQRIDHMSFGSGIHVCIGAMLARLEAQAVFGTLCRRFPDMELAEQPDQLKWNPHPMFHGLSSLPVRLGIDRGRPAGF